MEIVNMQLECKHICCFAFEGLFPIFFVDPNCVVAGSVPDFKAEQARVYERLNNATDEPTTGCEHFWFDGNRARTLVTLKDQV